MTARRPKSCCPLPRASWAAARLPDATGSRILGRHRGQLCAAVRCCCGRWAPSRSAVPAARRRACPAGSRAAYRCACPGRAPAAAALALSWQGPNQAKVGRHGQPDAQRAVVAGGGEPRFSGRVRSDGAQGGRRHGRRFPETEQHAVESEQNHRSGQWPDAGGSVRNRI